LIYTVFVLIKFDSKYYKLLIPLKRMAAPQEIAEAVYFMANASYITGEVVVVDGGLHLVL
jgi:NAD(P)-dependent dehydrogenase (short-subunit alcohol dehydrogenase family)